MGVNDEVWIGFITYQPLKVISYQIYFYTYKKVLFQTIQFNISTLFSSI